MKKRVKEAQKEAIRRGNNEQVNKEYFYPKKLFRSILNEYKNKSIKVGPPEESELEKLRKRIKEKEAENLGDQSSIPNQEITKQVANLQTPPLPTMPMPVVQTAALPGTNTNLTRTQQALLSPEEQIIASRRTT